jgi:hypothetical protein
VHGGVLCDGVLAPSPPACADGHACPPACAQIISCLALRYFHSQGSVHHK